MILGKKRTQALVHSSMSTSNLATKWLQDGMTPKKAMEMDFDTLAVTLKDDSMIELAKAFLVRVHGEAHAIYVASGGTQATGDELVRVRVVLAAYLVGAHPDKAFRCRNADELEIIGLAQSLTRRINGVAKDAVNGCYDQVNDLAQETITYTKKFATWKAIDEPRVIEEIRLGIVDLYVNTPMMTGEHLELGLARLEKLRSQYLKMRGPVALGALDSTYNHSLAEPFDLSIPEIMTAHEINVNPTFVLKSNYADMFVWINLKDRISSGFFLGAIRTLANHRKTLGISCNKIFQAEAKGDLTIELFNEYLMETIPTIEFDPAVFKNSYYDDSNCYSIPSTIDTKNVVLKGAEGVVKGLRILQFQCQHKAVVEYNHNLDERRTEYIANGIPMEIKAFDDLLDTGFITLDETRKWVQRFDIKSAQSHRDAMFATFFGPIQLPETLKFDVKRIDRLRNNLINIACSASVLAKVAELVQPELYVSIAHTYMQYFELDMVHGRMALMIEHVLDQTSLPVQLQVTVGVAAQLVCREYQYSPDNKIAEVHRVFKDVADTGVVAAPEYLIFQDSLLSLADTFNQTTRVNWIVHGRRYLSFNSYAYRFVRFVACRIPAFASRIKVPAAFELWLRRTSRRLIGV